MRACEDRFSFKGKTVQEIEEVEDEVEDETEEIEEIEEGGEWERQEIRVD